ncbi:MAG: hypothetical protein DWG79_00695 [Chloroflexi bacterium]|nr:hypothetical protein [Chloroflexota bacterium]MQC82981.1 hypothetical protein [Chloroflexota bacterium]PKB56528.1 MAG: hypothetical protein BZY69_01225 [SAR202 cluster bacterium Casp-Chloro-G1]
MGVVAVLAIAGLLILSGLYVTKYLPPRARVLTVEDHSYQARQIADRAVYLAFFEGSVSGIGDIAREILDHVIEEEALRRVGATTVDAVTPADIERELNLDLGLIEDDPSPTATPEATATADPSATAEGTATAEATGTAEATADPTAEATIDPQAFADALTTFLRNTGLSRAEYEAIIEARLYRQRLRDHFKAEVGSSGVQVRLQRIRVSTQLAADQTIAALEAGGDFALLADEQSVATEDGEGGEIGWTAGVLQSDDVQAAIADLEPGQWTAPITSGLFFEIYLVAEVAEDRAYETAIVTSLTRVRLDDWLATTIASLDVDEDLSADEESWINDRVLADVTSRLGG